MRRILALIFVAFAMVGLAAVSHQLAYARDGNSPIEALKQYQEMQERLRAQNARPAVRRTKVRASPFALPMPEKIKPAPEVPPSLFVYVLGDSLADQLASGLSDDFDDRPDIAVTSDAKADSGLVRTDFYDWNKAVADLLAANAKIDAVVILIGANDRQAIRDGDVPLDPQSDAWQQAYVKRIDAFLAPLKARNIKFFWVGLPPMRSDRLSAGMVSLNSLYRDRVKIAGGTYVDIWDGFVDADGAYAASGAGLDGQTTRLRLPDGVHFSTEGARVAAHFVEGELRRALGDAPPAPVIANVPVAEPTPETTGTQPSVGEKPEYGPVLPLDAYEMTPGGTLLGGSASTQTSSADPSVAKVMQQGEALTPKEGRADDFRWPPAGTGP